MPFITSITSQKRAGFYNVFIDGEYSFSLDEEGLLDSGFRKGDELSPAEVQDAKKRSADSKHYYGALRLLARRPRSIREIRNYLKYKRKIEAVEVIESIVKRLEDFGYLNDSEFACWWAEQRAQQGKGPRLIERELYQKGLSKEDITRALQEFPSETDLALKIAKKRNSSLQRYSGFQKKKRLSDFLVRRGFSWEVVKDVLGRLENVD